MTQIGVPHIPRWLFVVALLSVLVLMGIAVEGTGGDQQTEADAAGKKDQPSTISRLLGDLSSSDEDVVKNAAESLEKLLHDPIAPAVTDALAKAKDPWTRSCLVRVLAKTGGADAIPLVTMMALRKEEEDTVRSSAVYVLAVLSPRGCVPVLRSLFASADEPALVRG
jgi:HEAT repeat protein